MISAFKQTRRVGLVAAALGLIAVSGQALAAPIGTPSGTVISNTATVNYSVSSVVQTPVAANNQFVVDTVIKLNVSNTPASENVTPGQAGLIAVYTVTNTSNITSNFTLATLNITSPTDDFDMSNVVIHVDGNANGTYQPANDTATAITGLASGDSIVVFVTADTPLTATNNQNSLVRLTATAVDGSNVAWATDSGVDNQMGAAQVVVATANALAEHTFHVVTAALAVVKSRAVISDGLPGPPSANPKAIPGATIEYTITITNSGSSPATLQSISDPVPLGVTFLTGQYTGGRDVSVQVGAAPATFCIAEAGGTDGNLDGCVRSGATLTVGAPAVTTVAASSSVTLKFRVMINN